MVMCGPIYVYGLRIPKGMLFDEAYSSANWGAERQW